MAPILNKLSIVQEKQEGGFISHMTNDLGDRISPINLGCS
jgi:hypothetical protein